MHVSLTETLERHIEEQVESGLFIDASDVIRDALRAKLAAETRYRSELEELRTKIDVGWQQAERGEFVDLDLDALNRELDAELDG